MGNRMALSHASDSAIAIDVSFFRDLNVRWLDLFANRIRDTMKADFSLGNRDEKLRWIDYFRIFSEIRERRVADIDEQKRAIWHPATKDYAMIKEKLQPHEEESIVETSGSSLIDDHTDDAPSERSENDIEDQLHLSMRNINETGLSLQSADTVFKKKVNRRWDSQFISPIYFGYSLTTSQDVEEQQRKEKEELQLRENRAITKAKSSRFSIIDSFEKNMNAQEQARLKKMAYLESAYSNASVKRQEEFDRNKAELAETAFTAFQHQWNLEYNAAEAAFYSELNELRKVHIEKTEADKLFLTKKREEVEAFKDAEAQEMPAAERLEEFTRVEVSRCIENLEIVTEEMKSMRREYVEIKMDYDELLFEFESLDAASPIALSRGKEIAERKSMVNIAETRMKESQLAVEEALENLSDAEILLNRAVRIKLQQDQLLPLFIALANQSSIPSTCGLNKFIVAATILMKGSFEQKINYIFRLFDPCYEGLFGFSFLSEIMLIFQDVLKLLNLIKFCVDKDDVENDITRAFLNLNLKPEIDYLTEYEIRHFLVSNISRSDTLCAIFGVNSVSRSPGNRDNYISDNRSNYSSYQRSQMTPLALLVKGIIAFNVCRYRIHQECISYKEELNPERKQYIHERSLLMGKDDPNRADYTKFIIKQKKKDKYRVDPLEHGHLSNLLFLHHSNQDSAAVKIQSLFRSYKDRKLALLAAKHLAFSEAKQAAIKEMKSKVIKEFKKRESAKGMGKMKWDAQVRMRQAKLRSTGQLVNRSDTVMIMMEEAIANALEDIEAKFLELEIKENLHGINFEKTLVREEPSKELVDVTEWFGMVSSVGLAIVDMDDNNSEEEEVVDPAAEKGVEEEKRASREDPTAIDDGRIITVDGVETVEVIDDRALIKKKKRNPPPKVMMYPSVNYQNLKSIVEAKENPTTKKKRISATNGESFVETDLRMAMADAEPRQLSYLFNRLRAMHHNLTTFKTKELLAEFPSKRLLIKYVASHTDDFLFNDLLNHFKLKANHNEVIRLLRGLAKTDFENGLLTSHLQSLIDRRETLVLSLYMIEILKHVENFEVMCTIKLETNIETTKECIVAEEISKIDQHLLKYDNFCTEISTSVDLLREKQRKMYLSYCEISKQRQSLLKISNELKGYDGDVSIPVEIRYSWMQRLRYALSHTASSSASEGSTSMEAADIDPTVNSDQNEIRNVCKEFIDVATVDAVMIINEIYQPKFNKIIAPSIESIVNGRAVESGRGIEKGKYYQYEAHNIVYRICLDYDGLFNGSDEFAMKAGGNERLASTEYMKLSVSRLNIPLVLTIDYMGFRVLAMSKLDCQDILFNDEGEVRRISQNLVHGISGNGDTFLNNSKSVQSILRNAASKLNLAGHHCKGLQDFSSSVTYCSSEMNVYMKSVDGLDEVYAHNFWLALPPELQIIAKHLPPAPRDHTIFWRRLRPELVRTYRNPLSPDGCSATAYKTMDQAIHLAELEMANRYLLESIIPQFVENISKRQFTLPLAEGFGLDLSAELHAIGINIRHLGLIRSFFWRQLPGYLRLFHNENVLRTSKDLRCEVSLGDFVRIGDISFIIDNRNGAVVTNNSIPISETYLGDSLVKLTGMAGKLESIRNSDTLRIIFLGEMVARTIKQIIRFEMRKYNKCNKSSSTQFYRVLVCEYLNTLTGSCQDAEYIIKNFVYVGVRNRFGEMSVRPSERENMHVYLQPVVPFMIDRLLSMLGLKILVDTIVEFHSRPIFFYFVPTDIVLTSPIVKHNLPMLMYADAVLAITEAKRLEKESYTNQVLQSSPAIFFALSDRVGAREASNKGVLGVDYSGIISKGCELFHDGPIPSDKYIHAISFRPKAESYLDTKYHASIVPANFYNHYSVELFFRCTGGRDTVRTLLMSGRIELRISRENELSVIIFEKNHELLFPIFEVVIDEWYHLVVTYDGTILRSYVNSILWMAIEMGPVLHAQKQRYDQKIQYKIELLDEEEEQERLIALSKTVSDANIFFQTKDGTRTMRKAAQEIMESEEFQNENIGADAKDQITMIKMKKVESMKRAKENYIQESSRKTIRELAERFKAFKVDLEDRVKREVHEGKLRTYSGLRIGAGHANAQSRNASHYFYGDISCVSIYSCCLSADVVRIHYLSSQVDKQQDAKRLYSTASSKLEAVQRQSPDDSSILQKYARTVCSYLKMDYAGKHVDPVVLLSYHESMSKREGCLKIKDLFIRLRTQLNCIAIAEIVGGIPREAQFAELATMGLLAIKSVDRNFFSRSTGLTRKDIVYLPFEFSLIDANNPEEYFEAAAFVFQEVVKDIDLMFVYGEIDLRWLPEIRSPLLIVSLVKHANGDGNLRIIKIADMFYDAGFEDIGILDEDVLVLTRHLSTSEGFDLTKCRKITDQSLDYIDRMSNIRILTLNYCPLITNYGLLKIPSLYEKLEVLSLEGLALISDEGLEGVIQKCRNLVVLNVNNCPNISCDSVQAIARKNSRLHTIHTSGIMITDNDLSVLASIVKGKTVTSIDISFCSSITDYGLISLSEACPMIKYLNIRGLNRVSDKGVKAVCAKCWFLSYLNLEDIFLLRDDAFWFDASFDGRAAANESMLLSLRILNMTDCVNLTDHGIEGLAERSRSIESLVVRGCDRLTDKALAMMSDPCISTHSQVAMCDSFKILSIAFCSGFSSLGMLTMLGSCGILEELNLSGLTTVVTDAFIHQLCATCSTLQRLVLQKCTFLTDAALCSISDFLWIEEIDVSGCVKLTDKGLEVLTEACSGIRSIAARGNRKLSDKAVYAIMRNCTNLRALDLRDCPMITENALRTIKAVNKRIRIA